VILLALTNAHEAIDYLALTFLIHLSKVYFFANTYFYLMILEAFALVNENCLCFKKNQNLHTH